MDPHLYPLPSQGFSGKITVINGQRGDVVVFTESADLTSLPGLTQEDPPSSHGASLRHRRENKYGTSHFFYKKNF